MSKVFFVSAQRDEPRASVARKVELLWQAADLGSLFEGRDLAAVKLHVGEPGCKTYVHPDLVAELVRHIAKTGAQPFLTDTAVLYKSPRNNGVGHSRVAEEHGFGLERVGAPFIPADGLNGADEVEVAVDGKHFDKVTIATAIMHARSMLVISHATGHLGTGLGATLKNLGMGCGSKKAKLRQHHGQQPRIKKKLCTACGTCAEWCPSDAITVGEVAVIDSAVCIGCGECVALCLDGAVKHGWRQQGADLQERIVEHAAAVVRQKPNRIGYVAVAQAITKDCDCLGTQQEPLIEDLGLLASRDPVALDQAVLDLVRRHCGTRLEALSYPDHDATIQVRYAQELGLGECAVELVELPS